VYTIDRDGDGILDSEDDGSEPFGFSLNNDLQDRSIPLPVHINLRLAIETAAECEITCGACLKYLSSLRTRSEMNPADIAKELLPSLQLSARVREAIGGVAQQKIWLEQIIADVVVKSTEVIVTAAES
jgi:hypothetical protein